MLLRSDPGLSAALGAAGKLRVAAAFTVESMVVETVRAYEAALTRKRRSETR
jgi:hypothetical protein